MLCTLIGEIILSVNIQVGLNMHLSDDIGNASSSLSFYCSGIFKRSEIIFCSICTIIA